MYRFHYNEVIRPVILFVEYFQQIHDAWKDGFNVIQYRNDKFSQSSRSHCNFLVEIPLWFKWNCSHYCETLNTKSCTWICRIIAREGDLQFRAGNLSIPCIINCFRKGDITVFSVVQQFSGQRGKIISFVTF